MGIFKGFWFFVLIRFMLKNKHPASFASFCIANTERCLFFFTASVSHFHDNVIKFCEGTAFNVSSSLIINIVNFPRVNFVKLDVVEVAFPLWNLVCLEKSTNNKSFTKPSFLHYLLTKGYQEHLAPELKIGNHL